MTKKTMTKKVKIGKALLVTLAGFLMIVGHSGCTSGASAQGSPTRATLDQMREQFAPVEHVDPAPLEALETPPAPHPTGDTLRTWRLIHGQLAPVDGILFSDSAAAFVVVEYMAQRERFTLILEQQRERDQLRLLRDTEMLRLQMNGDRERFLIILETQERYIQDLEELMHTQGNTTMDDVWMILAGGGIGVLVGIVLGLLVAVGI